MGRWPAWLLLVGLPACAPTRAAEAPAAPRAAEASPSASVPAGAAATASDAAPAATAAADGAAIDEPDPGDDEAIDDGIEIEHDAVAGSPSPLAGLSDREIEERLTRDPASLGPISIGATNAGLLLYGVPMPKGERWRVIEPGGAFGTQETVDALVHCIDAVNERFPGTAPMWIGHISARGGGHLSPHKSHQAGRDVDLGYYYQGGGKWYARATAANLDRARTWALVRTLITDTDVELILIDTSIQKLLREHALGIGEDAGWISRVFQVGGTDRSPMIRHAKGHATHLHVRFFSPVARELGRRAYPLLVQKGLVKPPAAFVMHKAKRGQTLGSLANRYGTTVRAIQEANGLRSTRIQIGRTYRIPRPGAVAVPVVTAPVTVPPRRLPPRSAELLPAAG